MVAELHVKGASSIVQLMEYIESAPRELFKELIREINRLIQESQNQLVRNQMLYRRALEISREMLQVMRPGAPETPNLYRRDGYPSARQRKRWPPMWPA